MTDGKNLARALRDNLLSEAGADAQSTPAPATPAEYPDYFDIACKRIDAFRRMCDAERAAKDKLDLLTPRERLILEKMANGLSSEDICRDLGIHPRIEADDRNNLLRKLASPSRAQAIRILLEATIFD